MQCHSPSNASNNLRSPRVWARRREREGGGGWRYLQNLGSLWKSCASLPGKNGVKKLHFIAWERAREKGALRCTGKNERKKVALRCSGQSGRESCAEQGKREPRPAAANATERLAAPGGIRSHRNCECHRETGCARWLRMPPRDCTKS